MGIIFCNTKVGATVLANALKAIDGSAINSESEIDWKKFVLELSADLTQKEREEKMKRFKSSTNKQILVASDLASYGIDVGGLNLVVNYDFPKKYDGYLRRIGRTGRIGNTGTAISLICFDQDWNYLDCTN